MTLILVLGDVGSGKTLFTTYLASREKRPIYSNYKLKIPCYHPLFPETLNKLNKPALILGDEIYRWIESRTSGKHLNRYMSYILFQSRKKGLDFAVTAQLESTIDIRFRQMANYEVHCQQLVDVGFGYRVFKMSAFKRYEPIDLIMPYEYAEKLFPLYDSWEEQPIEDELIFNITQDKKEIIKDIDKVGNYLLTQYDATAITKGIVADYCLRNGYPKNYVEPVYNSLKATSLRSAAPPTPMPKSKPKKAYRLRE